MTGDDAETEAGGVYEAVFTALAHPARRRILISLNFAGGTMSAGQIARLFGHAWPTTTRHLAVLMAAGIVTQDRQGRTRLYRLEAERLAMARDWLGWFSRDPVTGAAIETDDKGDDAGDGGDAGVSAQHRGQGPR